MQSASVYLVVALCVLAFALALATWRSWSRWRASRRARRRAARAQRGEHNAEALLESLGYEIEDRQASLVWTIACDGVDHEVLLRADLLVERDGLRYVAEVKTGQVAPRLTNAATRRQLLEYRVAYDVDGVLLVDVESGSVAEVEFPLAGRFVEL